MSTNNYDDMPQRPEDPRDVTIRRLKAEVSQLAREIERGADRLHDLTGYLLRNKHREIADLNAEVWSGLSIEAIAARDLLARLEAAHA